MDKNSEEYGECIEAMDIAGCVTTEGMGKLGETIRYGTKVYSQCRDRED